MIRWLGKVIPLDYLVGYALLCVGIFLLPLLAMTVAEMFNGPHVSAGLPILKNALDFGYGALPFVLLGGALAYGAYRVFGFAPLEGTPYYTALLTMPYDGRKPLLAGPLLLVPQDAVLLAAVALFSASVARPGLGLGAAVAFFLSYSASTALFLVGCGRSAQSYALAVAVWIALRNVHTPWIAFLLSCVALALAWVCIKQALPAFPWGWEGEASEGRKQDRLDKAGQGDKVEPLQVEDDARESRAGWPLGLLAPREEQRRFGPYAALAVGLLIALGVDSLFSVFSPDGRLPKDQEAAWIAISYLFVALGVYARIRLYTARYRPPVSLLGRLASGRLVMPLYDFVLLTPLLALGLHSFLMSPYCRATIPLRWVMPLSLGLTAATLLGGPPSMDGWITTGDHRISLSNKRNKGYIQL